MGSVGVSLLYSSGLPCQQAQNDSLESSCDESNITFRGTGVCLNSESVPVCKTVCVNGVWVVVGGKSNMMNIRVCSGEKYRIIKTKSAATSTMNKYCIIGLRTVCLSDYEMAMVFKIFISSHKGRSNSGEMNAITISKIT